MAIIRIGSVSNWVETHLQLRREAEFRAERDRPISGLNLERSEIHHIRDRAQNEGRSIQSVVTELVRKGMKP